MSSFCDVVAHAVISLTRTNNNLIITKFRHKASIAPIDFMSNSSLGKTSTEKLRTTMKAFRSVFWWKRYSCAERSVSLTERLVDECEESDCRGGESAYDKIPWMRKTCEEASRNHKPGGHVNHCTLVGRHRGGRLVSKIDLNLIKAYHASNFAEPLLIGSSLIATPRK